MTKKKGPPRVGAEWRQGRWTYRFVVEEQDGFAVLAGLSITPTGAEPRLGLTADVRTPAGGITSGVLRAFSIPQRIGNELRLGTILAAVEGAEKVLGPGGRLAGFPPVVRVPAEGKRRPGRPGLDPRYFASLAVAYERRVRAGSRTPVADIARERRVASRTITNHANRARALGLLTKGLPGRAGGTATQKARRILAEAATETTTKRATKRGKGKGSR
jgi:hypothetical protein